MADLDVFRSTIARVLFALAFLHVPLLALINLEFSGGTRGRFSSAPPPACSFLRSSAS